MDEDIVLQQPTDRRLGNSTTLPPGPPGAEFDTIDFVTKNVPSSTTKTPPEADTTNLNKSSTVSTTSQRRNSRSSANSPPARRKSPTSRNRRTPPSPSTRRRRTPSPRRGRYFSPDRRRYDRRRSPPDRRRSPPPRRGGGGHRGGRDRDRFRSGGRGGRGSDSRSRSISPRRGGSGRGWSPKKKPSSPTAPPPPSSSTAASAMQRPPPNNNQQPQYTVMPPQMYGNAYGNPVYNQYGVQQTGFPTTAAAYAMQPPPTANFNAAYPPPAPWGVNVNDPYAQQAWMQQQVNVPPHDVTQLGGVPQSAQQPPPSTMAIQPQQHQNQMLATPNAIIGESSSTIAAINVAGTAVIAASAPQQVTSNLATGTNETNSTQDAIAQEAENQRDELKKQRTNYLKKVSNLKREMKMLIDQREDLTSDDMPPSPTTKGFIDENDQLQIQIQKKLDTMESVIDMLTGIIGEENLDPEPEIDMEADPKWAQLSIHTDNKRKKKRVKHRSTSSDSSSSSSSDDNSDGTSDTSSEDEDKLHDSATKVKRSNNREISEKIGSADERKQRCNYVFFDPEFHWCRSCNVFPKTARDYLSHLHEREHMDSEIVETPWHMNMANDQYPSYENAPTKRVPIRGLPFLVPATAWYCKLCSVWIGDLHCASSHLKSPLHSQNYDLFLEQNPQYEINWLAERERAQLLSSKRLIQPGNITTDQTKSKKSKKDEDKLSKKRKKKSSDKKDKKKKKKRNKRHKRSEGTTSSSSSDSSSSDTEGNQQADHQHEPKKQRIGAGGLLVESYSSASSSIRVAMRKKLSSQDEMLENDIDGDNDEDLQPPPPPPPPMYMKDTLPSSTTQETTASKATGRIGKWTVAQEGVKNATTKTQQKDAADSDNKRHDVIIQQWNTVQPVISESEKKLLEQLKGKLKNKTRSVEQTTGLGTSTTAANANATSSSSHNVDDRQSKRRTDRRRSRSPRRSYTRSRSRGRGGGGLDYHRRGGGRRSRSRSRGRRRRTRSRSLRNRRSRSRDQRQQRRQRSRTRTRSRTRSSSRGRIEKPTVLRHSEFRPRNAPVKRPPNDSKNKKDNSKSKNKSSSSTAALAAAASSAGGKKLPFIGKMPVFKKQNTGGDPTASAGNSEIDVTMNNNGNSSTTQYMNGAGNGTNTTSAALATSAQVTQQQQLQCRPFAPTAVQIQMAMMEDVYGNAPPFHPDAAVMVDYEDLMPDPVQFVNLMAQVPPPPPPADDGEATANKRRRLNRHIHDNGTDGDAANDDDDEGDDEDVLPPGIDENDDYVPKPLNETPVRPSDAVLPKDLAEALDIIFPAERDPDDEEHDADEQLKHKTAAGETQIFDDEPVMQVEDLVKQGIHMVKIDEHSMQASVQLAVAAINDDNSIGSNPYSDADLMAQQQRQPEHQLMNEPLSFAKSNNERLLLAQQQQQLKQQEPELAIPEAVETSIPSNSDVKNSTSAPSTFETMKDVAENNNNNNNSKVTDETSNLKNNATISLDSIPTPTVDAAAAVAVDDDAQTLEVAKNVTIQENVGVAVASIIEASSIMCDLDDIPEPPASPTESEKMRRKAELEELAMLGIDASDMAAQCM